MNFAGRRVLVVGLGVSGFAAARALLGLQAKVMVSDEASNPIIEGRAAQLATEGADVAIGGHDLEVLDAELAILSPGVPPHAPVVRALRERGIETISEVELAYRLARCDFIAVTGTNGKTTTTSLLAAMLKEAGVDAEAAGNIGTPAIDAISALGDNGVVALEVSSFQLETIDRFHPRVAVLLNIAEDHTDWHGSVDRYVAAKARIAMNQTADDVFVVNADDSLCVDVAKGVSSRVVYFSGARHLPDGVGVADGAIVWRGRKVVSMGGVHLSGRAGLEDAIAAAGAALEYGIEHKAVARAIKSFRPLAHRLEVVAEAEGITYVDDSKATNPHAAEASLQAFDPVVWVAGGLAKGATFDGLVQTVRPRLRGVVLIGVDRRPLRDALRRHAPDVPVIEVDDGETGLQVMDRAVAAASRLMRPGDTVLLAPACASQDQFRDYGARGDAFAAAVRSRAAAPPSG
jgi:UDP-N-acetylmuramoylalanine--D-glutamate ligase